MEEIIYILKIIYYFIFVFLLYECVKVREKKQNEIVATNGKTIRRISISCMTLFSIILGHYSIICGKIPYVSDRLSYVVRFISDSYAKMHPTNSIGLVVIEKFLHIFTYNPSALFFFSSFIFLFITLYAYKRYEEASSMAILLMGLSNYCIYSFYLLKQAPAMAFAALSFAEYSKNNKKLAIIYLIIAICFHESAIILIPLYLALMGSKSKLIKIAEYIFLICIVIFFEKINQNLVSLFSYIPGMSSQLNVYLNEAGGINIATNILTVFKGIPFYIITLVAAIKRKNLKEKIKNYDKYLLISTFASLVTILSSYMYWMYRFAAYCYFPTFIFASLIYKSMDSNKNKSTFKFILCFTFFIVTLRLLIQYYFIYGGI